MLQTIKQHVLIQIDNPVATHATVWRSATQRTLTIRYGVMVNGTFQELCADHFDGDDVPDIHDGSGWDVVKLQAWIQELGYMKVDLRNAPRDEHGRIAVEQGAIHVPSHEGVRFVSSHGLPSFAVDVKREIYVAVANIGGWVSRDEIAKAIGRKKSSWLNSHIEQLVKDGYLTRTQVLRYNGMVMYFYMVNL